MFTFQLSGVVWVLAECSSLEIIVEGACHSLKVTADLYQKRRVSKSHVILHADWKHAGETLNLLREFPI